MNNQAPSLALFAIPLLAMVMTAVVLAGIKRAGALTPRLMVATVAWWGVSGALAVTGVLGRFDARPPPVLIFMVACLAIGCVIGGSSIGARLAASTPLWMLVAVQAFRLPLELVMHQAATDGVMPVELSFAGYNVDILTGTLAVVVAAAARAGVRGRLYLWVWNITGILALVNIVIIALLTSPMVHAFGTDPAHLNTWVTQIPYVWLPAVLVVIAVAGHVVVTRALLSSRGAPAG